MQVTLNFFFLKELANNAYISYYIFMKLWLSLSTGAVVNRDLE